MRKYDPNNPRHVEESRTLDQLEVQADVAALKELLNLKSGRRYIWKWLGRCGVFKSSFDTSGSVTFFKEGQRDIGLKILAEVTAVDPDMFLQMMKENKKEQL